MSLPPGAPRKPKALRKGSKIAVFAPSSPAEHSDFSEGLAELRRLGFDCIPAQLPVPSGYFAGPADERLDSLLEAARNPEVDALIAMRGGYGANYLLEAGLSSQLHVPKCLLGFSDVTSLQIYLWQKCGWVTFYGPMLAAGFNRRANLPQGYDELSFQQAVGNWQSGYELNLRGKPLFPGLGEGRLLGGCLTLLQTSLATPWEIDTADSILVLEDRGMRPYQVDRALMHLKQAGKLEAVKGIVLGEFPDSEPSVVGSPTVFEVCDRILRPLGVPVISGAPVGHTSRPMLTIPLGVQARLHSSGEGRLEILEPAVVQ